MKKDSINTPTNNDYLLGVNEIELERLRFQHKVWGPVTNKFFDRLKIQRGWKCLDVGAGPGFVAKDLRERVGETGEVTALEPSALYLDWFKKETERKGWNNIKFIQGKAEEVDFPQKYFDVIFSRWVIAFVPDAEKFLDQLIAALRPGGIIALQDYWYEGLSIYPRSGAFERMPDAIRAYYRSGGGDPFVTGKVPSILKRYGLRVIDFTPTILSGGPTSDVTEWMHRFITMHMPLMAEKGVISKEEADALLADWHTHRQNLDSIYFSPIVVDIAGKLFQ